MKLKNILNGCPDAVYSGNREVVIQGISYSSKNIRPGYLFAALKGEKSDGVQFLDEALEKGAEAVLSENPKPDDFEKIWITVSDARKALAYMSANFYSHPSSKMKVIGITGTKGKTTTTYLLESILKQAKFSPGVIGTISYRGPHMKIQAQRTTPEAPDLQRMMSEMLEQDATHCMIEVSSHSLELKRVEGIDFDLAVFTNLSGEHLDYHHSMENYFEAKKKLFFPGENKRKAIINSDDRWGKKLLSELSSETIAYGLGSPAEIRAENYQFSENGIEFTVKHPSGNLVLSSPLLGKPNLYNLLAAITCSLELNIPEAAIESGISSLHHVPGRFEKIENSLKLNIFVDYAHTDDAMRNLLETARELSQKRVILVFGAGGDRDKTKRPRMGEAAGSLADWTIITSDNPRSESPMAIISEIETGIKKTGAQKYSIQPDRRKAIKQALSLAGENDFVLVAGKGHEDYQIIQNKILPFDDAVIIREILEDMEKRQ